MRSLDYVELSENEALDQALKATTKELLTQTTNQIIFTINGYSVPIEKLSKAYTHQKIELTCSQHGEKVMSSQREVALTISLFELSINEQIIEQ